MRLWVCVTPRLSPLQPGVMVKVQEEDAMSGEAPVVKEEVTSGEDVDRVVKAGGRAVCCNGKTLMATGVVWR